MNIYEKMSAITDEIAKVAKNLNVGVGKTAYKAVGEADVLSAVKPIENKYKVYSYPIKRTVLESNVITSKSSYDGRETEKNQLFLRIETVYRFVNIENPDEFVEVMTYGDGVDSQDKACGKAMTYADKYALMKAYKIETGDDPDQNASQPLVGSTPTTENLNKAKELGIDLENVKKAYKVTTLTNEILAEAIKRKQEYLAKNGANNG